MKIKKLAFLSTLFAVLLPTLVVATVIISYTYPTSTSPVAPKIYLEQGPNYYAANTLGLFYAPQTGNPANITSGTTIYINNTAGAESTELANVLEIVNNTGIGSGHTVTVTITVSLPSEVTMYYSTTGTTSINEMTQITSGAPVHLAANTLYLSFVLSSGVSGTETAGIAISYTIS